MTDELNIRHRAKVRQLLANNVAVGGYVVVVSFARNRVIVSFHAVEEAES